MVFCLHAFRNNFQVQRMTKAHNCACDGGIVFIDERIAYEGLVDLQAVDRELAQV